MIIAASAVAAIIIITTTVVVVATTLKKQKEVKINSYGGKDFLINWHPWFRKLKATG
jgi:hypothetical protein